MDKDRYLLAPSKEPYHWVCTDTQLGIIMRWDEIDFNDSQKVTLLDDVSHPDPTEYARAMKEMTDWIVENNPHTIFPDVKRIIGRELRERRESLGRSMQDVSNSSGLSVNNILRIEQGKYNYTIDTLDTLCEDLGLAIDLI